jgi:hypothetical protein
MKLVWLPDEQGRPLQLVEVLAPDDRQRLEVLLGDAGVGVAPEQPPDGPRRQADLPLVRAGVLGRPGEQAGKQLEVDAGQHGVPDGGIVVVDEHVLGGVVVADVDDRAEVVGSDEGELVDDLAARRGDLVRQTGELRRVGERRLAAARRELRQHDVPRHDTPPR